MLIFKNVKITAAIESQMPVLQVVKSLKVVGVFFFLFVFFMFLLSHVVYYLITIVTFFGCGSCPDLEASHLLAEAAAILFEF